MDTAPTIDVSGQASYVETVSLLHVVLTITAQPSKAAAAFGKTVSFERAGELRDAVVRTLRERGLRDDELREGGRQNWQPWTKRKGTGQEASYRVLIDCRDAERLYPALDALEPLFDDSRHVLEIDMAAPSFEAAPGAAAAAHAQALTDAMDKARAIAQAAGVALGAPAQIEVHTVRTESSHAYGDRPSVLRSRSVDLMANASPGGFESLGDAAREVRLELRARFVIGILVDT